MKINSYEELRKFNFNKNKEFKVILNGEYKSDSYCETTQIVFSSQKKFIEYCKEKGNDSCFGGGGFADFKVYTKRINIFIDLIRINFIDYDDEKDLFSIEKEFPEFRQNEHLIKAYNNKTPLPFVAATFNGNQTKINILKPNQEFLFWIECLLEGESLFSLEINENKNLIEINTADSDINTTREETE